MTTLPPMTPAQAEKPVPGAPPKKLAVRALPYGLLLPATLVLVLVLGYPFGRLFVLSMQKFGLKQQFGAPPDWVGLDNYTGIFKDQQFWVVLARTIGFCATAVVLTMVLGMLVALLTRRVGRVLRMALIVSLLFAWAMPPLSATVVWQWLFDTRYGLVNWLLSQFGGDFHGHSWLSNPWSFFGVALIIVVWMGIPFVAFTLYAGLTQVPGEVLEAAELDGAGVWQRFRYVILPFLRPVILILTALSVLWDLRVFTQFYVLQKAGGIARDTNVLGVYAYRLAFGENKFDVGAAVAVVMLLITLLFTVFYLRQITRQEEL
ncbi:sugar ABC transporter permease [Kineosporia rhizophila]|uniref:carbohydrate ABC transporter permease n=2 Tax=Kineosporia TaxID=49184 RepID=UPI001E3FD2A2|nr:sugar ABC transporter permease [Kineosporia rhizophila]MCE0538860.1 sugar ABC transporter permease [Kineosporia rhizophila]GLY18778.1 sugar ABC transporter permease [Kineosporia sp. NBRC 101677]